MSNAEAMGTGQLDLLMQGGMWDAIDVVRLGFMKTVCAWFGSTLRLPRIYRKHSARSGFYKVRVTPKKLIGL